MVTKSPLHRKLQAFCSTRITVFTATILIVFSFIICTFLLSTRSVPGSHTAFSSSTLTAGSATGSAKNACSEPHDRPDGGDCQAFGGDMRRPKWACLSAMRAAIPEFLELYAQRPVRNNAGGMLLDHAFALWYVLRQVEPEIVIESGAFKGQGTWLMRQALPHARIISVDPRGPTKRLPGVEYLVGGAFRDFAAIDWAARGVDPARALVFLDDHQSGFRRMLIDNVRHRFLRFIAEDNYPYPGGDNMSLKIVCELKRKSMWPGFVQDDFGRKLTKQTWEEHLALGKKVNDSLAVYYELPPLASTRLTGQKRWDPEYSTLPLISDALDFERLFGAIDKKQFTMYTHFTYVELKPDVFSGRA